jgi:hypothetical protein
VKENDDMCNCTSCIHKRVCGQKEKYEQYIKEFNELNKKWDLFEKNPNCPEYTSQDLLTTNHKEDYDFLTKNKDIQFTYDNKTNMKPLNSINDSKSNEADYVMKPTIISIDDDDKVSILEAISELKKLKYFDNMGWLR